MASGKRDVRDTVWKFQHLIKRNYRSKAQRCWWRGNYQNCGIKKNLPESRGRSLRWKWNTQGPLWWISRTVSHCHVALPGIKRKLLKASRCGWRVSVCVWVHVWWRICNQNSVELPNSKTKEDNDTCLQYSQGKWLSATSLSSGKLLIKRNCKRKTFSENQRLKYFTFYALSLGICASAEEGN